MIVGKRNVKTNLSPVPFPAGGCLLAKVNGCGSYRQKVVESYLQ